MRRRAGDHLEHVDALLGFIDETSRRYSILYRFTFPKFNNMRIYTTEALQNGLKQEQDAINSFLQALGGLPVKVANEGDEDKQWQVLSGLRAFDYKNGNFVWSLAGAPAELVANTPMGNLDEIRADVAEAYGYALE